MGCQESVAKGSAPTTPCSPYTLDLSTPLSEDDYASAVPRDTSAEAFHAFQKEVSAKQRRERRVIQRLKIEEFDPLRPLDSFKLTHRLLLGRCWDRQAETLLSLLHLLEESVPAVKSSSQASRLAVLDKYIRSHSIPRRSHWFSVCLSAAESQVDGHPSGEGASLFLAAERTAQQAGSEGYLRYHQCMRAFDHLTLEESKNKPIWELEEIYADFTTSVARMAGCCSAFGFRVDSSSASLEKSAAFLRQRGLTPCKGVKVVRLNHVKVFRPTISAFTSSLKAILGSEGVMNRLLEQMGTGAATDERESTASTSPVESCASSVSRGTIHPHRREGVVDPLSCHVLGFPVQESPVTVAVAVGCFIASVDPFEWEEHKFTRYAVDVDDSDPSVFEQYGEGLITAILYGGMLVVEANSPQAARYLERSVNKLQYDQLSVRCGPDYRPFHTTQKEDEYQYRVRRRIGGMQLRSFVELSTVEGALLLDFKEKDEKGKKGKSTTSPISNSMNECSSSVSSAWINRQVALAVVTAWTRDLLRNVRTAQPISLYLQQYTPIAMSLLTTASSGPIKRPHAPLKPDRLSDPTALPLAANTAAALRFQSMVQRVFVKEVALRTSRSCITPEPTPLSLSQAFTSFGWGTEGPPPLKNSITSMPSQPRSRPSRCDSGRLTSIMKSGCNQSSHASFATGASFETATATGGAFSPVPSNAHAKRRLAAAELRALEIELDELRESTARLEAQFEEASVRLEQLRGAFLPLTPQKLLLPSLLLVKKAIRHPHDFVAARLVLPVRDWLPLFTAIWTSPKCRIRNILIQARLTAVDFPRLGVLAGVLESKRSPHTERTALKSIEFSEAHELWKGGGMLSSPLGSPVGKSVAVPFLVTPAQALDVLWTLVSTVVYFPEDPRASVTFKGVGQVQESEESKQERGSTSSEASLVEWEHPMHWSPRINTDLFQQKEHQQENEDHSVPRKTKEGCFDDRKGVEDRRKKKPSVPLMSLSFLESELKRWEARPSHPVPATVLLCHGRLPKKMAKQGAHEDSLLVDPHAFYCIPCRPHEGGGGGKNNSVVSFSETNNNMSGEAWDWSYEEAALLKKAEDVLKSQMPSIWATLKRLESTLNETYPKRHRAPFHRKKPMGRYSR